MASDPNSWIGACLREGGGHGWLVPREEARGTTWLCHDNQTSLVDLLIRGSTTAHTGTRLFWVGKVNQKKKGNELQHHHAYIPVRVMSHSDES